LNFSKTARSVTVAECSLSRSDSSGVFWSSFVTRRDALARTTDTLLIYDDGRRDSTDYDEANAHDWANVVFRYDPSLVPQQTITTYDDGHVVII
jgi:hypothetical protein